jgi:hypothetical protein
LKRKLIIFLAIISSLTIAGQSYTPEKILKTKKVKLKKQKFTHTIKYQLDTYIYFFDYNQFSKNFPSGVYIEKTNLFNTLSKQKGDTIILNPFLINTRLLNFTEQCLIDIILKKEIFIINTNGKTISELIVKKVRDGEKTGPCYTDGIAIYTNENIFMLYKPTEIVNHAKLLD